MPENNDLLQFINCETLDANLYRGQSRDLQTGQVFGGQVFSQAIKAAQETLSKELIIHSAHAYFLRRGDVNSPIIYEVDRSRDGSSFASRRVVALQNGKQIFHLSSSFQTPEEGLDYYPQFVPPMDILEKAVAENRLETDHKQSDYVDVYTLSAEEKSNPNSFQLWIKSKGQLPDDIRVHQAVLAYISDMGLLMAVFMPHFGQLHRDEFFKNMVIASLDHAIWYHRPFRADEWFFYDCRVQSTSSSRGLALGRFYSADGTLIASTTQEGLMRKRK